MESPGSSEKPTEKGGSVQVKEELVICNGRKRAWPADDDNPSGQIYKCKRLDASQDKVQSVNDSEDGLTLSGHQTLKENSITTVDNLPDSLLVKILGYLPLRYLLRAGRSCKKWHHLTQDPDLWREISLPAIWQSKVNDEILTRLCSYSRNVTSLNAPGLCKVTGKGMKAALLQCPNLQSLTLRG